MRRVSICVIMLSMISASHRYTEGFGNVLQISGLPSDVVSWFQNGKPKARISGLTRASAKAFSSQQHPPKPVPAPTYLGSDSAGRVLAVRACALVGQPKSPDMRIYLGSNENTSSWSASS